MDTLLVDMEPKIMSKKSQSEDECVAKEKDEPRLANSMIARLHIRWEASDKASLR